MRKRKARQTKGREREKGEEKKEEQRDTDATGAPSPDWRFGSGLRKLLAEIDEEHRRAKVNLAYRELL